MKSMTIAETIEDIASKCGMSADIVRRVQEAERDHIIEVLSKGKSAKLVGRCTVTPRLQSKLTVAGVQNYATAKCELTTQVKSELLKVSSFNESEDDSGDRIGFIDETNSNIMTMQISGLE